MMLSLRIGNDQIRYSSPSLKLTNNKKQTRMTVLRGLMLEEVQMPPGFLMCIISWSILPLADRAGELTVMLKIQIDIKAFLRF